MTTGRRKRSKNLHDLASDFFAEEADEFKKILAKKRKKLQNVDE